MEFWKAWGTYSATHGIIGMYGLPDKVIIQEWKKGKNFGEVLETTQTKIHFKPYRYHRTDYRLVQPPIYIYSISICTQFYRYFSNTLINGRLFNFFLNIEPILSSALLTILIGWCVSGISGPAVGRLCALLYWLNPVVILNSPIQGYRDPLCVLFAVASIAMLYNKRLSLAFVFLALSLSTKPQGVLIAPVVIWVGFLEHNLKANVKAWGSACLSGFLLALPWVIEGHSMSVIQGVLSVSNTSHDLSRQSMNIWWVVQYAIHVYTNVFSYGVSGWTAVLGGRCDWFNDIPAHTLSSFLGFNIETMGFVMLSAFTLLNLRFVMQHIQSRRLSIIMAAALQVYGYFMLRVGVQSNHYFLLIPLFSLVCLISKRHFRMFISVCFLFFLQDLIFYGVGRDFNPGPVQLSYLYLGWTTVLLALLNTALFTYICLDVYRSPLVQGEPLSPDADDIDISSAS